MHDNDVLLTLITVPDSETADRIANLLIDKKLAACVNIVPGLKSVYRWKNETCRDDELLLIAKTVESRFSELKEAVLDIHPYDLPEIIGIKVSDGLDSYLKWIRKEVHASKLDPNI